MIRAKTVRSRDGTAWVVRRRWAPRPRWRRIVRLPRLRSTPPVERPKLRWYELLDPFELVTDFPVVIAVIALVLFLIFVGIPLMVFSLRRCWSFRSSS